MDALELLKADHDRFRDLFGRFRDAAKASASDDMASLQEEIFAGLKLHTAIEEEVFYPEAERVGGAAKELVREGIEEHHVADVHMAEIADLHHSDDAWKAKMTVLVESVEHHAEEEEEELFPQLREAFGEERLAEMGERLAAARRRREPDSPV